MVYNYFEPEWKAWIWNNIVSGLSKEDVFNILLNHGFDYELVSKELDHSPVKSNVWERQYLQERLNEPETKSIQPLYKRLCDNANVYRFESNDLEIYRVPNFLSLSECDELIESMSSSLRPSTITNPDAEEGIRTSSTCDMMLDNPLYKKINDKINSFMGLSSVLGEIPQGQKYLVGEEFKEHTDYFDENADFNKPFLEERGQRTWTFMVYLNDVKEGGTTHFPKIDMEFNPRVGEAIIWNNLYPDGTVNPFATHSGKPIIQGEKNIITKWFRQRGDKSTPQEIVVTEIIEN